MANTAVLLGADHRGYNLKAKLVQWLSGHGYAPKDLGTDSEERCDAFDFAEKMAAEFTKNPGLFGVLICGTGQAMAMTANRHKNIRAALCATPEVAKLAREHNDANVLVLGADVTDAATALKCLEVFLATQTLGGRYAERRKKLDKLGGL